MQHFSKNTLEASRWCNKHSAFTAHHVFNGIISRVCIPCQEKAEIERQARIAAGVVEPTAAVQEDLFAPNRA